VFADTINGTGWKGTFNDGTTNEGLWSNPGNWTATGPKTDGTGDRNLFFGTAYNGNSGTNFIAKNDLTDWHGFQITFDNVSPTTNFTITGNAFGLFDFGGSNPAIKNNSSVTQTLIQLMVISFSTMLLIWPVQRSLKSSAEVQTALLSITG
jgi:hypothetical protein